MQTVALIGLAFFGVCWALVIGHQAGWAALSDPDRYEALKATMVIAYVGAGLSVCAAAAATAAWIKK